MAGKKCKTIKHIIRNYLNEGDFKDFKGWDYVPPKERFDRFVEYDDGWEKKVVNGRFVNDEDFVVGNFYRIKFWLGNQFHDGRWFDIKVIDKKLEYRNHYRYKYETVNPEESYILHRNQNNKKYGFLNIRPFYEQNEAIKPIKPTTNITQNYSWGGYPYEEVYILGYYSTEKDIYDDYGSELITTRSISVIGITEFIDLTSEPPEIGTWFDFQDLSSLDILKHFNNNNTIHFNEDFTITNMHYIDGITDGNLTLITKDDYQKYYNSIIN